MAQKINRTALMCAADLLSRQEQSEARLRQKLAMRKYPQNEIDEAINKLKQNNYLDDKSTCENQFDILYQSKRYSAQQICFKLINYGFERQLVESFIPADIDEHDREVAVKMLRSKFKTLPDDRKMYQFLSTKGFNSSVASDSIDDFKSQFE